MAKGDTLTRYACGHVGTMTEDKRAKAKEFIRWAETRGRKPVVSEKNCPGCGKSE